VPPTSAEAVPLPEAPDFDPREAGRVVASVLLAGASPTDAERGRANRLLARLGRPALSARDEVVTTPEEIAARIPADLRPGLADIVLELSECEPLRRRLAVSYLGLWGMSVESIRPSPSPSTSPSPGPSPALTTAATRGPLAQIAKWFVGTLPRHQLATSPGDPSMTSIYRADGNETEIPPALDPLRERVARIREEACRVVDAVERVVVGKRTVVERVLTAMAARGHVLVVDAPGVGKTQMCKAIAAAIGVPFGRIQLTPDLLPTDLTGSTFYEAHDKRFTFRRGPVFTSFLLADEINRATPKTQSALLEVMEERTVTMDGTTHPVGDPFQVLATMNPLDHEGTYALPAAQIDRFVMMLEVGHLSPEDEVRVLDTHLAGSSLTSIEPVIDRETFLVWQRTVPLIHASPEVKRAAVDHANALRRDPAMAHAVSPRATLSWMRAAQARAMFSGREFVTTEDLLALAGDVMRHRLGVSAAEVHQRLRSAAPAAAAMPVAAGVGR
jgi:MoxR-like ATPase